MPPKPATRLLNDILRASNFGPNTLRPATAVTIPGTANLHAGTHVAVRRFETSGFLNRVREGIYWHHGIYVGNDQVIEFAGDDGDVTLDGTCIKSCTWTQFCTAQVDVVEIQYSDDSDACRASTVAVAQEALRRADVGGTDWTYNVWDENCESFATFCRTGRWELCGMRLPHRQVSIPK